MFNQNFFIKNQKLIRWFANTQYGKSILGHGLDHVDLILPNTVLKKLDDGRIFFETRTHDKYSKRLYYEYKRIWEAFHWFDSNIANVYIPQLNLGFDSYGPVYPDADTESTSVDGSVTRASVDEAFATIRAGAGNTSGDTSANDNCVRIRASTTSNQYQTITRGIFLFDTSALAGTVDSATLSLYGNTTSDGLGGAASANSSVEIVASTPASNTALVNADYSQLGGTTFGSSSAQSSFTTGGYEDITLNASGIAAVTFGGVSKFGTRYKWDLDNTTTGLTWSSAGSQSINVFFADQTGTSNDPKLAGTFTPNASGFFALL